MSSGFSLGSSNTKSDHCDDNYHANDMNIHSDKTIKLLWAPSTRCALKLCQQLWKIDNDPCYCCLLHREANKKNKKRKRFYYVREQWEEENPTLCYKRGRTCRRQDYVCFFCSQVLQRPLISCLNNLDWVIKKVFHKSHQLAYVTGVGYS